ncbi:MAG: ImmA/IrrE family metallo-endopeptidase [Bacteroidales bacterium]|nr:ImmA/IrrE family metallo-endopeptidase [Bacteroidales bacterium]
MNSQQRIEISIEMERRAMELRQEIGNKNTDPISIHTILRDKNILCLYRPLDNHFSGMAIKTTTDNAQTYRFMLINSAQVIGKQRFTACHELYHLLYQKDFRSSRNNAGLFNEKDIEEYKADIFAAFLLLPTEGIRLSIPSEELTQGRVTLQTVISLEQRFRCSRQALLCRLKDLRLIDKDQSENYSIHPMRSALEYGYSKELYQPTLKNEIIGDYNTKARELYDKGMISQARYYELLKDMGIDLNQEKEQ